MSTDGDLIKLYSQQILALAADLPLTDRLDAPDSSAKKRSPLCGSTVQVDICVSEGRVSAFGQDVKACALGQAAASVVGPFDGLKVLLPARGYKNRHASIMLTLDATVEAVDAIDADQQRHLS